MPVVKRLVSAAIGWFVAFGLLHGPAGNGAVILLAAVAGTLEGVRPSDELAGPAVVSGRLTFTLTSRL
jgi:hypothetical protein